jgi:hypothetical protein
MSLHIPPSKQPALRTLMRGGVAATITAALATTAFVGTAPVFATPGQSGVTTEATTSTPTADLLDIEFAADGAATDVSAAAHTLTPMPTAGATSEEAGFSRWVASLDGSQAWGAAWTGDDYTLASDGVSLETVFKLDAPITSGSQGLFGNKQSIGLELVPGPDAQHGAVELYANTTAGYGELPTATFSYGEWVHVVATFDGTDTTLYVDGALGSEQSAGSATLAAPDASLQTWGIGDDVDGSAGLVGDLAFARIYSEPIDESEAYRLAATSGFAQDTVAPEVNAVTTPVDHAELNVEYVAPDIEATDALDPAPGRSISVTGPDGVTAPIDLDTRTFTPEVDGVYTLVYQAVDAAGNVGTVQYSVTVGNAPRSAARAAVATAGSTADSTTDWKFSAIGDIHDNWDELVEAYNFWATQGVETTLWPGDLTNGNSEEEYVQLKDVIDSVSGLGIEHYASLGNHDVAAGQLGDYALFETATGQRPNADYIVNGYHVITVSPGSGEFAEDATPAAGTEASGIPTVASNGGYKYAAAWLESRLAAITAAEPEKPIFVLVHHPIRCTHYVSNEWYGSGLATGCGDTFNSFLENYPQAVVWAGHIHTPNHIPTSIWQGTQAGGGFTTVNAPPLAYYEMETGVVSAYENDISDSTPDDAGNNRETAIVEVDGSKVKITNYDLLADMWEPTVWEWDVADSIDTTKTFEERFPLGDARANHTSSPVWQADDAISVTTVNETTAQVDWTQAEAAPNDVHDIVQKYLVEVVNAETSQTALSFYRWSQYYVMPLPATVGHEVWDLDPGTEYKVQVTPINAWAKAGAPLTTTFTTAGEKGPDETSTFDDHGAAMPIADLLDVDFDTVSDVSTNPVPYTLLGATGTGPATSQPVQILVSAADKLKLVDGYTTSAAFVANGPGDVFTYGNPGLVSNVMRITPLSATRGTLTDVAVIQGAEYELVHQTITYGQPYHVALRFTITDIDLWFNGERIGESDVSADLRAIMASPAYNYYMVAGGSTDGAGNIVKPFDGEMTVASAYSTALTDIEMARIAHEAQPSTDFVLPAVRAVSVPATTGTAGVEFSFPKLESVDDSGTVAGTSITIVGPSGNPLEWTDGAEGTFTPLTAGTYTLLYAAIDGAGNDNSVEYPVTVAPAAPGQEPAPAPVPDTVLDGAPTGGVSTATSTATGGEQVVITVGVAHAGEQVRVWLHSTPTLLGTFTVSSAGTVTVTLPAGVPADQHRLVVQALDGSLIGWTALSVTGLAFTGNAFGWPLALGLALGLLLLGSIAVLVMRRERTTP